MTFNFRGSGGLATWPGGLLTLFIYIGYFVYFQSKLVLVDNENGDDIFSYITPIDVNEFNDIGEIKYKDTNLTFIFKIFYKGKVIENIDTVS